MTLNAWQASARDRLRPTAARPRRGRGPPRRMPRAAAPPHAHRRPLPRPPPPLRPADRARRRGRRRRRRRAAVAARHLVRSRAAAARRAPRRSRAAPPPQPRRAHAAPGGAAARPWPSSLDSNCPRPCLLALPLSKVRGPALREAALQGAADPGQVGARAAGGWGGGGAAGGALAAGAAASRPGWGPARGLQAVAPPNSCPSPFLPPPAPPATGSASAWAGARQRSCGGTTPCWWPRWRWTARCGWVLLGAPREAGAGEAG
jgi:hypothetical protein